MNDIDLGDADSDPQIDEKALEEVEAELETLCRIIGTDTDETVEFAENIIERYEHYRQ